MRYAKPKIVKNPISKPQNSLLSDKEWAKWLSFFADSGWKKTEEDIANPASPLRKWLIKTAKKHPAEVAEKICLICGEKMHQDTRYYISYGICKTCYCSIKTVRICKPKPLWKIDLAQNACSQCGRYGIYDLTNFYCKSCYNKANRIKNKKTTNKGDKQAAAQRMVEAINSELCRNQKLYKGLLIRRDFGFGIN